MDLRDARLGQKIGDWEQSGYPVRIECGERDIAENKCVVVSRISGEKTLLRKNELNTTIERMHAEGQKMLFETSRNRLRENTIVCETLEDIGKAMEAGQFALYEWDKNPEFETIIKDKYKATTRCIPFAGEFTDELLTLKNPENVRVIVARSF